MIATEDWINEFRAWLADCDELLATINGTQREQYPHIIWAWFYDHGYSPDCVVEFALSGSISGNAFQGLAG